MSLYIVGIILVMGVMLHGNWNDGSVRLYNMISSIIIGLLWPIILVILIIIVIWMAFDEYGDIVIWERQVHDDSVDEWERK